MLCDRGLCIRLVLLLLLQETVVRSCYVRGQRRRRGRIWHRRRGRSSLENASAASRPRRPTRADAMSVSFDAIRTALDAIWRPIAALRPTRCRRRQNSTRITQQLSKHTGLYRQSAQTTLRRVLVGRFGHLQLQPISEIFIGAFGLFCRHEPERYQQKSNHSNLHKYRLQHCFADMFDI